MNNRRRTFPILRIMLGLTVLTFPLYSGTGLTAQESPCSDAAAGGSSAQDAVPQGGPSAPGTATAGAVLSAVVDSKGTLIRGHGAVSARRLTAGPGRYEV